MSSEPSTEFHPETRYERFFIDATDNIVLRRDDSLTFKEFSLNEQKAIKDSNVRPLDVLIGFPGIGNIGPELVQILSTIPRAVKLCSIRSLYHEPRVSVIPFVSKNSSAKSKKIPGPESFIIRAVAPRDYVFYLPQLEEQNGLLLFTGINPMNDLGLMKYSRELMDYLERFHIRSITVINGLSLDKKVWKTILGTKKGVIIGTSQYQETMDLLKLKLEKFQTSKWIINAIYGGGALVAEAEFRNIPAQSLLVATDIRINTSFPIDAIAVEAGLELVAQIFHLKSDEIADLRGFVGRMAENLRKAIKESSKQAKREEETNKKDTVQNDVPGHAQDFARDRTII